MNRPTLAVGAFCASVLSGTPAGFAQETFAPESCGQRSEIIAKLAQDFKESQQAVGVVNEQAVVEVYVSGQGTWTIIASGTDGSSCILTAGKDWEGPSFVKGFDTGLHRPASARLPADRGN